MKNKPRKSLILVLAAFLLVALALSGCGSSARDQAGSTPGVSDNTGNKNSRTLEQIKQSGVLKVGIMGTYAPYNFLNDKKEMDGFDADIAKEIAKKMGLKAEFVSQEFSGMIAGLQAGKFDTVISQMTITEDRQKQMDFTEPYITNQVKVIVKQDNNSITKLEDFKGKNIGVGLGTNDEAYLRNEALPKVGNFTIKTYDDVITSLQDLNNGRIDATINNMYALKPIVEKNGFKIKVVGEAVKSDKAAIAVTKGNTELRDALNQALKDLKADGTYKTIFTKWFCEEPPAE
ncbi:substrate-binding periplasmic protein [Paenibacillus larvae]|uniref:Cystine-binding periplasmic protein n=1 Tax=Paenibacillus larvae subsp. larvae DSM 25430 TaxID=697284 RepID=V9W3C1_9BACL|nr:ABC transporter substrate-binding protein [Paenibacillus larvae]AHD05521.1 cystine-binding periplasmic protein [Paenibacillus larvae subsp. larvae DSM 25430]AVG12079.1 cystine-binding periplasmic protein [Paenibacillus larvae subsp. larvae DSM 25430]MDR5569970.1 ABC transporter substrate-binding protein [Paenibacillus larvae]MDR5595820.1 ABC transporter substrate-binding protein [Paenibacillus larvae]